MSKDDIIRFRCDSSLRERFESIAKEKRREPADLARIIFEDYIAAEENNVLKEKDSGSTGKAVVVPAGARAPIKYGPIERK